MANMLWVQKQDIGPSPRVMHGMAYDSVRKKVVLFGGYPSGGGATGDTWEWDGVNWTQVADSGPSPRGGTALAFDSDRERVVLFGGHASGPDGLCADTWEWEGEFWTQISDTGPEPCEGHQIVYDPDRKRVVLFGGYGKTTAFGQTWEWDGSNWIQQDDTGPRAREYHAMAYDTQRNCVVLFGGIVLTPNGKGYDLGGDTWERKNGNWKQQASFGPEPRMLPAIAFDGHHMMLFGGMARIMTSSGLTLKSDGSTWEWNGKLWTQRQDIGPKPRQGHGMVFDSDRQQLVLFGGETAAAGLHSDTWELPRA